MIKRKIIQMSNSSFMVTLPKEWAVNNGIEKGEEIEFGNAGDDLVIKSKKGKELEIDLDLTNVHRDLVWRHLVCAYRKGAKTINIKYESKEYLDLLMLYTRDLMGCGIVSHDKNKIIVKEILPHDHADFDETVKEVFILVLNISEQVLEGFKKQDKVILKNIPYVDWNINKFTNLCMRKLNLRGPDFENTNSLYKIVSTLEEIGDEYRKLAIFYVPAKPSKEILDIFYSVNQMLKDYHELFYSLDKKKLNKFYEGNDVILDKMKKFKGKNMTETKAFATLFSIYHMVKSLAEENLVISL